MTEESYRKLIIKELKGETSPEESQRLDALINESPENLKLYHEIWSAFQLASPDVEFFDTDKELAWTKIVKGLSGFGGRRLMLIQYSRIAAAAVIFFMIGLAVQYALSGKYSSDFLNQYSTIVVPKGQKSMIVLPDGSNVWLNSGSKLTYKGSFNAKIREVNLEGEAYFDVKKDPGRMFRVKAGSINIEVYGTQFDVKNYDEEKNLEVTVESGKVGIVREGNKLAELIKGKQILYNGVRNEIMLKNAKIDVVTAWKNNELVFDGAPFEEVIRYLERWYGVNITIEEKMKKSHNYTFKVKTESIRELLDLIKKITPLTYQIDGNNVTIRYAN